LLEIIDESHYSPASMDNARKYSKEYSLSNQFEPLTKYGIILSSHGEIKQSIILIAHGWGGHVHEHTALVKDDVLYLAIGNQVCGLSLPKLDLSWYRQVDTVACFGVYYSPEYHCLISHGELEIARLNLAGDVVWTVSGKDIFSEGFDLYSVHIEVVDFNREKYRIEILDGKIKLI